MKYHENVHPADDAGSLITTEEGLLDLERQLEGTERVALDLETTGLDPHRDRVRLLTLVTGRGTWIVDCFEVDPRTLFPTLVEKELVIHNALFDLGMLTEMGFELGGGGRVIDTMVLSRLLEAGGTGAGAGRAGRNGNTPKPTPNSLDAVVRRELGIELDKKHQTADWGGELSPAMLGYAATDARVLPPLVERLEGKAREAGLQRVVEIESRALPAVVRMKAAGVPFDAEGWETYLSHVEDDLNRLEEELAEQAPPRPGGGAWNCRSPQQIKGMFDLLGISLPNTKEETLSRCDHPLARLLVEHKRASKMLSSFGPKLLASVRGDGRIHPEWRQNGAETGRMSCSNPNVQQLPQTVRRCVRAPEGRALVWADYAQAEIRVMAAASGDPALIDAFRSGKDPYRATAANMYGVPEEAVTDGQRAAAKVVNFSFIYGANAYGIAKRLGITNHAAERLKQRYFDAHPRVYGFIEKTVQEVLDTGDARTLAGRLRRFGNVHSLGLKEARAAVREAMNHPVQGSCADGLKLALALLHERRHECPGAVPIIALHDELVVECDEKDVDTVAAWLVRAMKDGLSEVLALGAAGPAGVPVEVEVETGRTWGGGRPWSPPVPAPPEEDDPDLFTDEAGPARVAHYIDYRDPSADNYPQIVVCEECADRLGVTLEYQEKLSPGEEAWCETC